MASHPPIERASRSALRERLEHDRHVHVYGLGDLTDAYWARSRWWQAGEATIGEIGLPGEPPDLIVYAINAGDPSDALHLWGEVDHLLPDRYFATGPIGFPHYLTQRGRIVEFAAGEHVKYFLENSSAMVEIDHSRPESASRPLDRCDLGAIDALQATGDDPASFFHPGLFDDGPFHGVFEGPELIAMAGVHVCSHELDVAAVGCVLVHPQHRGRGLGSVVTTAVCRSLLDRGIDTIGLNVRADNTPARAIYERLGFTEVHRYEEALIAWPDAP